MKPLQSNTIMYFAAGTVVFGMAMLLIASWLSKTVAIDDTEKDSNETDA